MHCSFLCHFEYDNLLVRTALVEMHAEDAMKVFDPDICALVVHDQSLWKHWASGRSCLLGLCQFWGDWGLCQFCLGCALLCFAAMPTVP